jgi:YfiH family protein
MEMIENYRDGIFYYQFKSFNNIGFIKHLFSSRIGWNNKNIFDNISNIFDVPSDNIINVKQVHGTEIMIVDENLKNFKEFSKLEKDGLITNIPNLVLTTYHADCVPIYFLDKRKKVVGVAHGGWRGTYNNISGKMIDTMIDIYGSNTEDIIVGIGPSIGPCCYEVSKELGQQFTEKYNNFKDILHYKDDSTYLDLWKINYLQVKEKNLLKDNIILSKACTSCHIDKFYSYRKEKGTKNRMVAAISIAKDLED